MSVSTTQLPRVPTLRGRATHPLPARQSERAVQVLVSGGPEIKNVSD